VSRYHRRQLIEESFAQAEQVSEDVWDTSKPYSPLASRFHEAAVRLATKSGFNPSMDFQDYRGGSFPDDALEWSLKHLDRLQSDPVNVMSDWIDQHPRARQAVDTYCANKAQEDLTRLAQTARATDLASPEEAMARRNRGRMM